MGKTALNIIKVAVTGGAGSGKTFVCDRLKELGAKVISSDALAREAVAKGSPAYKHIANHFGEKILLNNGNLNRQMLRRMIINDDAARRSLETFIHPEITKLMMRKVAHAEKDGERMVLVEGPLLFELGMEDQFNAVIVISAHHKLRVKRLMDRDNVTRREAEELINVQMPDKEKVERARFVVLNNGSKNQLIKSVDLLHKNIVKISKKELKSLDSGKIMI